MKAEVMFSRFKNYLIECGYKEYTPSGLPSTVYQYVNAIEKVRVWEGFSYAEIDENIDELCREYDYGGSRAKLGAIGHSTVINALKKYRVFLKSK